MKGNLGTLVRGVLLMALLMGGVSGVALLVDVVAQDATPARLFALDADSARNLVNLFSRASNQLVGVVFTTVAIAVPLTANMYSLKFLEFFIRDRVNAAMLILAVFAGVNTVVTGFVMSDAFVPRNLIRTQFAVVVLTFTVLFPYLYYLFRFLHPSTLLARLADEVQRQMTTEGRTTALPVRRRRLSEGLEHIANIAVRSVDRLDRNTAIETVHLLEDLAARYAVVKDRLRPEWHAAEPSLFLSFSSKAVEEMNESRSWVEMKILSQLRLVVAASLTRTHDVVSAGAKTLRRIGALEAVQKDVPLRELVVEHFNTFVRLAITARDVRSVFILFDQYRILAEELMDEDPELAVEIADYFRYYGDVARAAGLTFVVEAVAHDLGALVKHAYETDARAASAVFDRFLAYGDDSGDLAGVRKAQAILASFFLVSGRAEVAGALRERLRALPPSRLDRITRELLQVRREKYWEVNERRMNLDYVPPEQRERLQELLEDLRTATVGREP
jgi:hypothetical protein